MTYKELVLLEEKVERTKGQIQELKGKLVIKTLDLEKCYRKIEEIKSKNVGALNG